MILKEAKKWLCKFYEPKMYIYQSIAAQYNVLNTSDINTKPRIALFVSVCMV